MVPGSARPCPGTPSRQAVSESPVPTARDQNRDDLGGARIAFLRLAPDRRQPPPPERESARGGPPPSARCREERRQQGAALAGADTPCDLDLVVEPGVGAEVVERSACTRPGVARPVDDPADPGRHQSAGAHRAGFESDHQGDVGEPPPAHGGRGVAQHQDLGVRSGVGGAFPLVVSGRHDLTGDQGDRADGNLPSAAAARASVRASSMASSSLSGVVSVVAMTQYARSGAGQEVRRVERLRAWLAAALD